MWLFILKRRSPPETDSCCGYRTFVANFTHWSEKKGPDSVQFSSYKNLQSWQRTILTGTEETGLQRRQRALIGLNSSDFLKFKKCLSSSSSLLRWSRGGQVTDTTPASTEDWIYFLTHTDFLTFNLPHCLSKFARNGSCYLTPSWNVKRSKAVHNCCPQTSKCSWWVNLTPDWFRQTPLRN